MFTDGANIFVEHLGKLLSASQDGQQAMREALAVHLKRVERNSRGEAIRLFPFTTMPHRAEDPRAAAVDPAYRFGRPFVVSSGVETSVLFARYRAGESMEGLATDFQMDRAEIEEAIRYESLVA